MNDKNFRELILSMQEAGHLVGTGEFVDKSTPIILNTLDRKNTTLPSFQSFKKDSEKDKYKEINIKDKTRSITNNPILDETVGHNHPEKASWIKLNTRFNWKGPREYIVTSTLDDTEPRQYRELDITEILPNGDYGETQRVKYSDLYKDYEQGQITLLSEKLIQSDSDEAFKKNVQMELDAGKPRKQALAIAYSVKEKNRMKKENLDEDLIFDYTDKDIDKLENLIANESDPIKKDYLENTLAKAKFEVANNKFKNKLNEEKKMDNYYIVWNHFDPDDLEFIKDEFDKIEDYYGEEYNIEEIEDFKSGLYFIEHNDENANIFHTGYMNEEDFYKGLEEKLSKIDLTQDFIEIPILKWELDFDLEEIDHTIPAIIDYVKEAIDNSYVDGDSMSAYELFELSDKDFTSVESDEDEDESDNEEMEEIKVNVKDILDRRDEEDAIYIADDDFPGAYPKDKFKVKITEEDGVERTYTMEFDGIAGYSEEHPEFKKYSIRFKIVGNNESLQENKKEESIIEEIKSAIRDYFSDLDDEDYEDLINDYLRVEVTPADNGMTKVEVRAELGYNTFTDLIDEKLDKIVQKYDKDAYFDMEDAGITNAFIKEKFLTESTKSVADEMTEAGGKEAYIIKLEDELNNLDDYRDWLDTQGIKEVGKGGQFDSIEDLNKTIEDIEQRMDEIKNKLTFVRR